MRGERMTVRQQWAFVGIVVLILGGGLLAATRYLGDELFPVTVGSKAPDFRATHRRWRSGDEDARRLQGHRSCC